MSAFFHFLCLAHRLVRFAVAPKTNGTVVRVEANRDKKQDKLSKETNQQTKQLCCKSVLSLVCMKRQTDTETKPRITQDGNMRRKYRLHADIDIQHQQVCYKEMIPYLKIQLR